MPRKFFGKKLRNLDQKHPYSLKDFHLLRFQNSTDNIFNMDEDKSSYAQR